MSNRELSALNCVDISGGSSSSSTPDVGDVPDLLLEALHEARKLQQDERPEIAAIGLKIENKLRPAIAAIAAAAEQLAEVA